MSSESKDVIDVSKKCSATAAELLSELEKVKLDLKGGLRQAIGKSVRAIRKKKFLTETEKKLEKYQSILNTRILSKLDAHAIRQTEQFDMLDQSVKVLADALSQGRNTVTQLLASQTTAISEHVDRRMSNQAHAEALQRAQQHFKDSLFFPEIFARQDDISTSHEGTCRWIFGTPGGDSDSHSEGESVAEDIRAQPWSSFVEWLEKGEDVYW